MSIARGFRRSFLRGLAALLPALLTFIVIAFGISLLHTYVGRYVNTALKYILHWSTGLEMDWIDAWYRRYWLGALGVLVAIIGLAVVAYFVGTFIGNRLVRFFDASMTRMPLLRRIYPGAKQVSEFFFAKKQVEFRRVVAIEYPRRGLWSIGFVTGRGLKAITDHTEQEMLTVFIPSSPTPVTGYILAVPRREVIDLDVTVDQAFQFTLSGGVIVPPGERLESWEVAQLVESVAAERADPEDETPADAEADIETDESETPEAESPAPERDT
jgi:uncharacterized membrane protein